MYFMNFDICMMYYSQHRFIIYFLLCSEIQCYIFYVDKFDVSNKKQTIIYSSGVRTIFEFKPLKRNELKHIDKKY